MKTKKVLYSRAISWNHRLVNAAILQLSFMCMISSLVDIYLRMEMKIDVCAGFGNSCHALTRGKFIL
jgi:hypothetical protein